jgi:hypothetical protein
VLHAIEPSETSQLCLCMNLVNVSFYVCFLSAPSIALAFAYHNIEKNCNPTVFARGCEISH